MLNSKGLLGALLLAPFLSPSMPAQQTVTAHVARAVASKLDITSAVLWLEPLNPELAKRLVWKHMGPYRLVQKNKMFSPHLLVVPVGASISFPNDDPFFHNVFSLFNGKRFDLGLYEGGTNKEIPFERAGISYLFCNIHPQMSAVVIVLKFPLFSLLQRDKSMSIENVPTGEYYVHLWLEGEDENTLAKWTHRIVVTNLSAVDAGTFQAGPVQPEVHLDKFGKPYKREPSSY